jgi:hypothetical protein
MVWNMKYFTPLKNSTENNRLQCRVILYTVPLRRKHNAQMPRTQENPRSLLLMVQRTRELIFAVKNSDIPTKTIQVLPNSSSTPSSYTQITKFFDKSLP